MNLNIRTAVTVAIVILAILAILAIRPSSVFGQTVTKSVAVVPGLYREGGQPCKNSTAIKTADDTIRELFTKAGYEWIDQGKIIGALKRLDLSQSGESNELLKPEQMLKLGKELGVDLVVAYRTSWRIRSVWVGLGPKTKAHCATNAVVVDVKRAEVIYEPEAVETDSTKVEKGLETAGALLVTPLVTVVSGGPKTPHMQASAQKSMLATFGDFFKEKGVRKIRPN